MNYKHWLYGIIGAVNAVLLSVPLVSMAVTVSEDITLQTKSTSGSVTLASGSTFDTLTVNSNSFTFDLSGSQSVTLQSGNERMSSNVASVAPGCNGSLSNVTFSATNGSSVTIIMEGNVCSSGGGGGGGGGGGSSGSSNTTATQTTSTTAAASAAQTTTAAVAPVAQTATPVAQSSSGTVAGTPVYVPVPTGVFPGISKLNRRLSIGSSGEDVRALQEALASMTDVYPEGTASGYFGALTKAAVAKFQMKYGIVSSSSDAGYGSVGPMTRAKLVEVFGSGAVAATPAPSVSAVGMALTRELGIGATGDDVTQLQAYLAADPALYPEGKITGYYGSLTVSAIKRFQAKYGISQIGRVGPQTLSKLNEVMRQSIGVPSAPNASQGDEAAKAELQKQITDLQALIESLTKQVQSAR